MSTEPVLDRLRQALSDERLCADSDRAAATDAALADVEATVRGLQTDRLTAQQAAREHAELLGRLSHELRTPMTAILGFAGILGQTLRRRTDRDAIDTIRRNGERLLALIDDVLDMARIDAGSAPIEVRSVDLRALIDEVVEAARQHMTEGPAAIEVRCAREVPPLRSDEGRVRQVLTHLLANAIDVTDVGDVRLEVDVMRRPAGVPAIRIAVHDAGPGLAQEELAHVFEPLRRSDVHGEVRAPALGLALSQRIVRALGGRILVDSERGAGTTFSVVLPVSSDAEIGSDEPIAPARVSNAARAVRRPAPEPIAANRNEPVPAATSAPAGRRSGALRATAAAHVSGRPSGVHGVTDPVRVLVVEDSDDIRRIVELLLGTAGAEVAGASDGVRAVEMIRDAHGSDTPYDIVLMDLGIPLLDGFGVVEQVRAAHIPTPIVAVTGRTGAEVRRACREAGFNEYMTKPINPTRLVETVFQYGARRAA